MIKVLHIVFTQIYPGHNKTAKKEKTRNLPQLIVENHKKNCGKYRITCANLDFFKHPQQCTIHS